jgi:hypothetical protein
MKLMPLRYGPFEIIKQVNENAFGMKLPPCIQINLVLNVEYLNFFEPSMLDEEEENHVLPTVENLAPHGLEELKEDIVMQHKEWTNCIGQQKMWHIGLKEQTSRKVK